MAIRLGGITEDAGDPTRFLQVADIMMSGSGTPRTGFLLCDGSAVSRAVYANLFAAIGINFGPGDGVTTFNLPDFRGRSPMGEGTGSGLSPRVIGDIFGEELHVLSVAELATHTHLQNSHNHTQDAHNHTQDSHTHTVTDPGHNHTQSAHNHTQDSHNHTQDQHQHIGRGNVLAASGINEPRFSGSAGAVNLGVTDFTTATNQATTATNQSTTATNNSNTTGITNAGTVATNQATTATNQATTATNQNEGSSQGHNTVHPILVVLFQIKF